MYWYNGKMTSHKTLNYLRGRFTDLSQKAVEFNKLIKSAKTQFKKDFYQKKLHKINKQALDVLMLLQASQSTESVHQHDPDSTGNES
jgi:ATP-dependent protease ClpP protease subunit